MYYRLSDSGGLAVGIGRCVRHGKYVTCGLLFLLFLQHRACTTDWAAVVGQQEDLVGVAGVTDMSHVDSGVTCPMETLITHAASAAGARQQMEAPVSRTFFTCVVHPLFTSFST